MIIEPVQFSGNACELFSRIADMPYSIFLDSSAHQMSNEASYSILAALPYKTTSSLPEIEQEIAWGSQLSVPPEHAHLPFFGGAIGYISYEAVRHWERHLQPKARDPFCHPDILFGFYDTFAIIDHRAQKAHLVTLNLTADSQKKFDQFKSQFSGPPRKFKESATRSTVLSNLSQTEYEAMISKAKHYIEIGDIYQVNLSQCLYAQTEHHPFALYQRIRSYNPGNFSAYVNFDPIQILSSSPERFLAIDRQGTIQTEPIKGTIQRGETPEQDEHYKENLLTSVKNRAELMMIVDLERNDLGKICMPGTIYVRELCSLRSFATVHHLVSVIQGTLKTRRLTDILIACFPGGSITGAPKLRAMQIIDELEPHHRGIYTGSIGYIDYRGQVDLNIVIRTITHQNGSLYFPVGGGIVDQSNATAEYEETLHKGKALITAVST